MKLAYPWPGNVRELQNCIERAVTLASYEEVMVDERRYLLRVIEAVAGNKTLASRILGLDRKTLYRKLERFGEEAEITVGDFADQGRVR